MRSANKRVRNPIGAWRQHCGALILFAAAMLTGAAQAESVKLLVQSSPLAGLRYHEAAKVWTDMHVGDPLRLVREPDNPYDPNAIRVEWQGLKLGYVPRRENGALAWAMDHGEGVQARISVLREHRNKRRRIEFEVYVE